MTDVKCLSCAFCYDDDEGLYCSKKYTDTCISRSPLAWVGGKFYLAEKLIPMFPKHTHYVEPFGGAAHVLFKKPPSDIETYNDIDGRLVNFFRVMQDKEKCDVLCNMLRHTLYAREVFDECKAGINSGTDIRRAYCFAVSLKMSFGAKMKTWGIDISGGGGVVQVFARLPDKIEQAYNRIRDVQIEHKGFEYILKRYDTPQTFFYLDPPYPYTGERGKNKQYSYEMSNADHEQMVTILLNIKGKAMLSGYDTPLYKPLEEAGWNKIDVGVSNMNIKNHKGTGRPGKREFVWVRD